VVTGDRRHAFDQLGGRHRHAVDRDGKPAFEGNLELGGPVEHPSRRDDERLPALERAVPQRGANARRMGGSRHTLNGHDADRGIDGPRRRFDGGVILVVAA
jgi:hypothetical protein